MPIEVPSFWDYLGQAGNQGVQNFQEAKARVQKQQQEASGLATQLFGAGAIGSDQLTGVLGQNPNLPKMQIQPNAPERARTPGTPEYQHIQAGAVTDKLTTDKAAVVDKWRSGAPISEQEATFAGLPTAQDIAQAREAKADPILERAGTQYIDNAVLKMGGRITASQAQQLSQTAFQQYVNDYKSSGQATLSQDQLSNAQRYFGSRAMQLLVKQREDDTARVSAQNRGQTNALSREDKVFTSITGLLNSNNQAMDSFFKANPAAEMEMSKDIKDVPDALKGVVRRGQAFIKRNRDLQTAQSQVAMGIMPKSTAALLGGVDSGDGGGAGIDQTKVNTLITRIKADKSKRKQLDAGLASGQVTQEEYAAVKTGLGEK